LHNFEERVIKIYALYQRGVYFLLSSFQRKLLIDRNFVNVYLEASHFSMIYK